MESDIKPSKNPVATINYSSGFEGCHTFVAVLGKMPVQNVCSLFI